MSQNLSPNLPEAEQQHPVSEMVDKRTMAADHSNDSDTDSVASSEASIMETFDKYRLKIEQLLNSIGLGVFPLKLSSMAIRS